MLSSPPNYFWNKTCLNVPRDSSGQANATVCVVLESSTLKPPSPLAHSTYPRPSFFNSNTFECLPGFDQLWQYQNGQFVNLNGTNMCLTVGLPGDMSRGTSGSVLTTAPCDPTLPAVQNFVFDVSNGGNIVSSISGRCVDAGHTGQIISYNPGSAQWAVAQTRAESCEEGGINDSNPPFLPRTSLRDYTVGVKNMASGSFVLDRLIILDGDNADNNVWTSDDCGLNWK